MWDGRFGADRMGMKIPGKGRQSQSQGVTVAWRQRSGLGVEFD